MQSALFGGLTQEITSTIFLFESWMSLAEKRRSIESKPKLSDEMNERRLSSAVGCLSIEGITIK